MGVSAGLDNAQGIIVLGRGYDRHRVTCFRYYYLWIAGSSKMESYFTLFVMCDRDLCLYSCQSNLVGRQKRTIHRSNNGSTSPRSLLFLFPPLSLHLCVTGYITWRGSHGLKWEDVLVYYESGSCSFATGIASFLHGVFVCHVLWPGNFSTRSATVKYAALSQSWLPSRADNLTIFRNIQLLNALTVLLLP